MNNKKPDATFDLKGVVCPINFIKTKLKLEEMDVGKVLEVILDSEEAIANVPRSIEEVGHKIISVNQVEGYFHLLIEKI